MRVNGNGDGLTKMRDKRGLKENILKIELTLETHNHITVYNRDLEIREQRRSPI